MTTFRGAHRLAPALFLGLVVAKATGAVEPTNWPHPRGPHHTGVVAGSNLVREWPEHGPPVLWRRTTGQGYSGFVIDSDRFYTQFQTPAGQFVACFELSSGREVWRTRYGLPWQLDGEWPGPYASPVLAQEKIYFAGCFGEVGCVRARDGKPLWSLNVQKTFKGKGTEFGYGCTPLVDNGKLYLPVGGEGASVIALNASTGNLIWKTGSDPASYCGSLAITVDGHRQIVSYLQNITVAHDAESGRELWRHTRGHGYAEHAAWPIWTPPYLFYSEPFREGTYVLKLDYLAGAPRMVEVWHSDILCNDIFSSVIANGYIFGFDIVNYQAIPEGKSDGQFKCIELTTGKEMWSVSNTGHAMVMTDRTNLIIFNESGDLILADATPDEYRERARTRVFDNIQCWVSPAWHDGRLLIRAKTNLICLYLGNTNSPGFARLKSDGANTDTVISKPGVFDRNRSDAYFAPTPGELTEWFGISIVGVILPVIALGFIARKSISPDWILGGGTAVIALAACPIFTDYFGRLMFTWPVTVHAIFFGVVQACLKASTSNSKKADWIARSALLGMIAGSLAYHDLCQRNFMVMGWGFLVGILPTLPFAVISLTALKKRRESDSTLLMFALWTISFSVFYWSAAAFILWRT